MVTTDDKAIHILDVAGLSHVSRRLMPKRPSALAFTPSDSHVLCADKFGDLYAVPTVHEVGSPADTPEPAEAELRKPSANESTVHSKRNLRALEHQKKNGFKTQKIQKSHLKDGLEAAFTADPVLGHVSMVTDLLCIPVSSLSDSVDPAAHAIVTADRDEHIRVSRGLPDSHIIHGFCLGHKSYVSRLCHVRGPILVSGGGDDFLCVWDWQTCKLLEKLPIKSLVEHARGRDITDADTESIAVSGLWAFDSSESSAEVLCTCEGLPGVLVFTIDLASRQEGVRWTKKVLPTSGNVLSLAKSGNDVLAALDGVHQAGSTSETRETQGTRLEALHGSKSGTSLTNAVADMGESFDVAAYRGLAQSLYTIGNIRKREYEDAEAD